MSMEGVTSAVRALETMPCLGLIPCLIEVDMTMYLYIYTHTLSLYICTNTYIHTYIHTCLEPGSVKSAEGPGPLIQGSHKLAKHS